MPIIGLKKTGKRKFNHCIMPLWRNNWHKLKPGRKICQNKI